MKNPIAVASMNTANGAALVAFQKYLLEISSSRSYYINENQIRIEGMFVTLRYQLHYTK